MYNLQFEWKSFKIWLPDLHNWVEKLGVAYAGCSADSKLTLHFTEEPSDDIKERIKLHVESLTEEEESLKAFAVEKQLEAVKLAQEAILTMKWDDMSVQERKLVMGQMLTSEDKFKLVQKYLDNIGD